MRRAFTLIELLVVTAILALLAAIVMPSLAAARAEARRGVCAANLHELGLASAMYLDANREHFWRLYDDLPEGRRWWFGLERGGPPPSTPNARYRPLIKRHGVLAPYLGSTADGLQCPEFPYNEGAYWPKFAGRSASYGYNLRLGPPNTALPVQRRADYLRRSAAVFMFADAAHYDFEPDKRINEGFYIEYSRNPAWASGYAHYRHRGRAQVLFLDGHVQPQPLRGPGYTLGIACRGRAGNLSDPSGVISDPANGPQIYGQSSKPLAR